MITMYQSTIKYSEPEKITDPWELNSHGFSVHLLIYHIK